MTERNITWLPIITVDRPQSDLDRVVRAYLATPVRVNRSQRYSLTLTHPLPEPVWRRP